MIREFSRERHYDSRKMDKTVKVVRLYMRLRKRMAISKWRETEF